MKFYETHFEDYINNTSIHSKLSKLYDTFPPNIKDLQNLIFYGPAGSGKYSQVLYAIKKYSPSELKYEKKISITYNKNIYHFKMSDIHYEIDMSLLGCQSKVLWNEIFHQIIDIINATQSNNTGIIVCKYFHEIHSELLEIFYSYMQTLFNNNINIKFIIITEEISFIPNNVVNCCQIINIERPNKSTYIKEFKMKAKTDISALSNIKVIKANIKSTAPHIHICNRIIEYLINYQSIKFLTFRDLLYDIFIYNINIFDCVWYILFELVKMEKIKEIKLNNILKKTYAFFQYYNNNYRPIYHLENYLLYLVTQINEF
jgi:hypothetical protein